LSQNLVDDFIQVNESAKRLLQGAPAVMGQFLITPKDGFVYQLPDSENKPHMSSTAECLRVIVECESLAELSKEIESKRTDVLHFFDSNCWESGGIPEHNIYVAPRILDVLSKIGIKRSCSKVDEAIKEIVKSLRLLVEKGEHQSKGIECSHGFILYWVIRALKDFETELADEERSIFNRILEYSANCLFKQLALYFAGDDSEFDVVQLAYYLSTSVIYGRYSNREIIDKAIDVVFENQQRDGTWKLSHPFLQRPEGGVMNCSSIEVPTAIMRIHEFSDLASKYIAKIKKSIEWVEKNFKKSEEYKGWRSDSHVTTRVRPPPESWASAQVYEFLDVVSKISERCITNSLLKELHAEYKKPEILWPEVVDFQGIKEALEKSIIKPITQSSARRPFKKCSILLFGPPGTGKDTIAYALAYELGGWPTVSLSSADFLANGPDNIIKTANEIFAKLMMLEKALIFFNEVDELFVSRETEQDKLGKFITNSMLPLIEELKKNGKVVFVVATNHVERFESAVQRRGRFDLVLPIGPPELKEKTLLVKRLFPELAQPDAEDIAKTMDRRMTIREIIGICEFVREQMGERNIKEVAIEKAKEINQRLEIDIDTMSRFEHSLKSARLW